MRSESKIKIMNAEKARELSKENQISSEKALEQIKATAETGSTSCNFWNLGEQAATELMKLGYKLSIHKDPISGIETYICIW